MFKYVSTGERLVKLQQLMLSLLTLSLLSAVMLQPAQGATQVTPKQAAEEQAAEEQVSGDQTTQEQPSQDHSADATDEGALINSPAIIPLSLEPRQADAPKNEPFVVYVIRHAEQEEDHVDPGLTRDGYRRADGLAQLLRHADIDAIYSTYYRRNLGTVLPLARELATPIEFYQAQDTQSLVENVLNLARNTLIVGHSNTVADIVKHLGGEVQELNEQAYGDLFQLIIDTRGDHVEVYQVHLTAPLLMQERRQR